MTSFATTVCLVASGSIMWNVMSFKFFGTSLALLTATYNYTGLAFRSFHRFPRSDPSRVGYDPDKDGTSGVT